MKKLIVISSALIAFSAVNLFANDNNVNNGKAQAISASQYSLDTVPKKDTTKKKDSIAYQIVELHK
ncbi:MAG: hypothetical protein QM726_13535 [Chitinophagaceae bacterium]